ncbi:hypothetical protein GCM10029992_48900 [Glycomyces albus]
MVEIDGDVPPDIAALLGCAVLTGGGAVVNAGRPEPGQTVAVVGLGGVGMAALLVAAALGHEVVGVDAVRSKLELARSLGAAAAYTPDEAAAAGVRVPVAVEAAGSARAFETAYALTAPGGTTVTVGLPGPDARASIAPLSLTAEARTVVGSYLGSAVPGRDIPATRTCGGPGTCRSTGSSPTASGSTTSPTPSTASPPVRRSASSSSSDHPRPKGPP